MTTRLLLDSGNSRLKWAFMDGGTEPALRGVVIADDTALEGLAQALRQGGCGVPDAIHVLSVRGVAFEEELRDACDRLHWPQPRIYHARDEGDGVHPAYPEPILLGADRYGAMVAAHRLFDGPVLVVDCGTAVTVDALAAGGRHMGGLILPGLWLMRNALDAGTAAVQQVKGDVAHCLLADNTAQAVAGGTLLGLASAVDGLCDRVTETLGVTPHRLLCGGDAAELMSWLKGPYQHCPWLVLQGLDYMTGGRSCAPWP
ncbi:MAG: type III pantothenate kinase [Thioalkalivibrio sp.]